MRAKVAENTRPKHSGTGGSVLLTPDVQTSPFIHYFMTLCGSSTCLVQSLNTNMYRVLQRCPEP